MKHLDVVIVGAGFSGLYLMHRCLKANRTAVVLEQGSDVGGTWYWNRYPGARCDAESLAYSFSFSSELEQEWTWSERYAPQPEILDYARHVAERFGIRPHIRLNTRVTGAVWNGDDSLWTVTTEQGESYSGRHCVMATGCLSVPQLPDIEGLDSFEGVRYQASRWPHEPVSFKGQRVGIIGTGSSGIQSIPVIAAEAEQLTVFQRTPNFSVPAKNSSLDNAWVAAFKANYAAHRHNHRIGNGSGFGDLDIEPKATVEAPTLFDEVTESEAHALLEAAWQRGGARFMGAIGDTMMNQTANDYAQQFIHHKIRSIVRDPETAEALCPTSHPVGTRRICVDIDYFETYNKSNVRLLNVAKDPIIRVTESGVLTESEHVSLDTLVLATGFDAMTGALLSMDIRGKDGIRLEDEWAAGPKTYLGLMMADFPNLWTVTGPGSPSVLSNMMVSIEQHVDWICDCLDWLDASDHQTIEAEREAQEAWVSHVQEVAEGTLFPKGGSWYLGANVPGKPRIFMPYAAGVGPYRIICDEVAEADYRGFATS